MSVYKKKDRAGTRSDQPPSEPIKGVFMEFYHPPRTAEPSGLVAFDLREPEDWRAAHDLRAAWGRTRSRVHILDPDHVVLELLSRCATDARESA